jgi:hypothetical protein
MEVCHSSGLRLVGGNHFHPCYARLSLHPKDRFIPTCGTNQLTWIRIYADINQFN